jgi:hypothetical protein
MKLFIKEDFLESVCDQNNLYNSQVITAASSTSTWIPVTVSELTTVLGLFL